MSEVGEIVQEWTNKWGEPKRDVRLAWKGGPKAGDDDLCGVLGRLPAHRLAFWHRRFKAGPLPAELHAAEAEMVRRRLSRRTADCPGQLLMFDE